MAKTHKKSAFGPVVNTGTDRAISQFSKFLGWAYSFLPVILSVAFVVASLATLSGVKWGLEALGNVLLIAGAVLIASGSVVSSRTKHFLITIKNQEVISPTYYLRHTHLLRFVIHAINLHNKGWSLLKIKSLYVKQHAKITTPGGVRSYLTQARAAEMLLQSSSRAEAGTILIVLGTVLLMIRSFCK